MSFESKLQVKGVAHEYELGDFTDAIGRPEVCLRLTFMLITEIHKPILRKCDLI